MLKYFIDNIYIYREKWPSPTPTPLPTPAFISPNSMKKYIPVRNHLPRPTPIIMHCPGIV